MLEVHSLAPNVGRRQLEDLYPAHKLKPKVKTDMFYLILHKGASFVLHVESWILLKKMTGRG